MSRLASKFEGKVGDVYYTSWGYDQTNYDYIIIVSVSASGKSVVAQRCQYVTVGRGAQTYEQQPNGQGYGNTFRMKVIKSRALCGSYIFCGEDSKRFDYFYEAAVGQTFHETDPVFGH